MQQGNSEDIPFSHLQSDAASASVKLCPEDSEHGEGGGDTAKAGTGTKWNACQTALGADTI